MQRRLKGALWRAPSLLSILALRKCTGKYMSVGLFRRQSRRGRRNGEGGRMGPVLLSFSLHLRGPFLLGLSRIRTLTESHLVQERCCRFSGAAKSEDLGLTKDLKDTEARKS